MQITVYPGQTLWEALYKEHTVLSRPCGGKGTCGGCTVHVDGFGDVVSCRFTRPGRYSVTLPAQADFGTVFGPAAADPGTLSDPAADFGMASDPAQTDFGTMTAPAAADFGTLSDPAAAGIRIPAPPAPCAAIDIGTTTVAALYWDGLRFFRHGFTNPQRIFGADVMSRLEAAENGRLEELGSMIRQPLTEFLGQLPPCTVFFSANTAMLHLLRGFSCEGLGHAPFRPVSLALGTEQWHCGGKTYDIVFLPGISAYIGADVVSGIYHLGLTEQQDPSLLLDLGTNGEMALAASGRLLCTSAAAGPAFEGSRLGMRLHASGILRCLARMLSSGAMDASGLLAEPYFGEGCPVPDDILSAHGVREPLRVTQQDVREIQLAKGAIRAGIDTLLREAGIRPEQLGTVFLAGGMGFFMDPADAVAVGLLPASLRGKILSAGNTSLLGALTFAGEFLSDFTSVQKRAIMGNDTCGKISRIPEIAEEVILADTPHFEERFLGAMNFAD